MSPPMVVLVDSITSRNNRFRLWLPVILAWPFVLVALAVIMPFAAIAELLLYRRGIRPLSMIIGIATVVMALRGTIIDVRSRKQTINEVLKIYIQ